MEFLVQAIDTFLAFRAYLCDVTSQYPHLNSTLDIGAGAELSRG
jgi:hypothetical protein